MQKVSVCKQRQRAQVILDAVCPGDYGRIAWALRIWKRFTAETQWVKQTPEIAARSYDVELKSILRDGIMSDPEMENFLDRLSDKKRPLDEVRDFSFARQAWKELESGK